jgi:glutamate formiminotransferase/formiminotetrahydrofolate cyclodeaminase
MIFITFNFLNKINKLSKLWVGLCVLESSWHFSSKFLLDFNSFHSILDKMKIVECVPNISEGKDIKKINALIEEVKGVKGVRILDIHSGASANRTVLTLVGTPEAIKGVAFKIYEKASKLIDMRKHKGQHPRIGAVDVCPFIPLEETTMEECVEIARDLGKKVSENLRIPVYLYGEAVKNKSRGDLSYIREGGYEGLGEKMRNPKWEPDYGNIEYSKKSGATAIGARDFLIAFNVNLNTKDKKIASIIAGNIRESGGEKTDNNGKKVKIPGSLKAVKAIGWYIEEFGCAQVSTNLTNFRITPLHLLFEEIKKEANKLNIKVTGSELIGLVPEEAIIRAGEFYLGRKDRVSKKEIINTAIFRLGLSEKSKFIPEEKILEYKLKKEIL